MPKSMENMKGYGRGYKPPSGSAGGEAKGAFSHSKNPRPVPKKGSNIRMEQYGMNADKSKVKRLQSEQERNEAMRGYGC
jgi:hypothetical protein